jgi:hypothetical protein
MASRVASNLTAAALASAFTTHTLRLPPPRHACLTPLPSPPSPDAAPAQAVCRLAAESASAFRDHRASHGRGDLRKG